MALKRINLAVLIAAQRRLCLTQTATADAPKGLCVWIEGGVAWTGPLTFEPFHFNCATLFPCALN